MLKPFMMPWTIIKRRRRNNHPRNIRQMRSSVLSGGRLATESKLAMKAAFTGKTTKRTIFFKLKNSKSWDMSERSRTKSVKWQKNSEGIRNLTIYRKKFA